MIEESNLRDDRMKIKKKILKMNKKELGREFLKIPIKRKNFNCSNCSNCYNCSYCYDCYNCSNCYNCSYCYDCSDCSYCSYCTSQNKKRFMILDVQFTEKEYKKWQKKIMKSKM